VQWCVPRTGEDEDAGGAVDELGDADELGDVDVDVV
jgi:hypothetical protein